MRPEYVILNLIIRSLQIQDFYQEFTEEGLDASEMSAKGDIEASNYLDLCTGYQAMIKCAGTIPKPALVALKRAADRQNPFAQLQLAYYMMRTNPIDRNALALLMAAAKAGLCEAHFQIGMLHIFNL
jgi:hypothetical protein